VRWRVGGAQQIEVFVRVCVTGDPWRVRHMELRDLC